MTTPFSPRALFLASLVFLNAPLMPAHAGVGLSPKGRLSTDTIRTGVVIARGNELAPPFTLAIESDTLCVYDGAGRRFVSASGWNTAERSSTPPIPRLLAAAAQPQIVRPEIHMAQMAHILRGGGAIAFGDTYMVAFPPSSAAQVLPDLRWIAEHKVLLSDHLPHTNPFLRDLMWPARLAAPEPPNPS